MKNTNLDILQKTIERFQSYHKKTVPLCAAENVLSEFTKIPLCGDIQERYIMNNYGSFDIQTNFIGSEYLLPFYQMIQDECFSLFNAIYSDARTLTGMNCLTTLLMSLTKNGDNILLLPDEWGGHPSVKPVCERLGLNVFLAPYFLHDYDLDYDRLNEIIKKEKIDYILLAPSDIIKHLAVEKIQLEDTFLLYDISQIMGLIAVGLIKNPLVFSKNVVLFGGTHKTLPGPASGLILTNNKELQTRMENNINPKYLRHTQMHQVVSLLFALLELKEYGKSYMEKTVMNANLLGYSLVEKGFTVGMTNNQYSFTHQVFILCDKNEMTRIFKNGILYGVTLNKKEKSLFNGYGIRLGVQEISRYNWGEKEIILISQLMDELRKEHPNEQIINQLKNSLPEKQIHYTYPQKVVEQFKKSILGS